MLLATGADEVTRFKLPRNVDFLRLPGLRKVTNSTYAARRLPMDASDIHELRSSVIEATVRSFQPDVLVADKHPFGVHGELTASLHALRRHGGRAVLGLRDILDDRETVLAEWKAHTLHDRIAENYDQVLVYGKQEVFDPIEEYDFPPDLAEITTFCGYVLNAAGDDGRTDDRLQEATEADRKLPLVLATSGGGEDGFAMLSAFIDAAAGAPWQGVVVAGPRAAEDQRNTLRASAKAAGVRFHSFVPGVSRWIAGADALVCMGGYNTLAEALAHGTPTVCVPRTQPRQEQLIRARAFDRLGLLTSLEPGRLEPAHLRAAIDARLRTPRLALAAEADRLLDLAGAHAAAGILVRLAEEERRRSAPLRAVAR